MMCASWLPHNKQQPDPSEQESDAQIAGPLGFEPSILATRQDQRERSEGHQVSRNCPLNGRNDE